MKRFLAILGLLALAGCAATKSTLEKGEFDHVQIRGNTSISRLELLEAAVDHLRDYERRGIGKSAIDDAAYRIELTYRSRGYAFATVDYLIEGRGLALDADPSDVVFIVEEGPRVVLAELQLDGGGALTPVQMRDIVLPIAGQPGQAPFIRRVLDDAAVAVLVHAREKGFADARADAEVDSLDRETGLGRARIVLTPGTRYVIDSIELSGDAEAELARPVLDRSLGEPFEPRNAAAMLSRLEESLRDAGYPDVHAEIAERTSFEGRVHLVVAVTVGLRVKIGEVRFEGDLDTRGSYLRELVDIEPGSRYSAGAIRAASQRIYASGLFVRVQSRLDPPEGAERDLVFELIELPSLELWVEPGWGSYDGPRARAGLREQNLLGTGWVLRAEGTASAKTRRAETGVTDPVFIIPDLSLDTSLQYVRREEPSFEYEEASIQTSLRRKWTDELTTVASYRFKRSNLIADDLLSLDPTAVQSDFDVSAVKVSAVNDTRDNLLGPRAGARIELSAEFADSVLGSQINFIRGAASLGLFHELWPGLVGATRVSFGAIAPTGDTTNIPLQERYFLGGENSVRSFSESQLGPKDASGQPTGGEAFTLGSLELRQSLPRRFGLVLFADAGSLQEDYSDVIRPNDYRYALGIGLRYELPVGSLRVDVGWNPSPALDEDDYAVHFSIGQAF